MMHIDSVRNTIATKKCKRYVLLPNNYVYRPIQTTVNTPHYIILLPWPTNLSVAWP